MQVERSALLAGLGIEDPGEKEYDRDEIFLGAAT
jgi:hypothetical protein